VRGNLAPLSLYRVMQHMRGQWLFLHVRGGNGWEWQRLDRESGEPLERSGKLFATLRDCIVDAAAHGYPRPAHSNEPAASEPRSTSSSTPATARSLKKPAAKS
jgi:hypothetical protein